MAVSRFPLQPQGVAGMRHPLATIMQRHSISGNCLIRGASKQHHTSRARPLRGLDCLSDQLHEGAVWLPQSAVTATTQALELRVKLWVIHYVAHIHLRWRHHEVEVAVGSQMPSV